MSNTLNEQFKLISEYCEKLEEADYDSYKIYSPVLPLTAICKYPFDDIDNLEDCMADAGLFE